MSRIIVLSSFHHNWHQIRSVTTIQYHFQHRLHLYYQSCCCPVLFSSQMVLDSINLGNSIQFSTWTVPVRSVTSLPYLVFIANRTRSDMFKQFSFGFDVDQIYTINHVIVQFCFHHISDLVQSIMVAWVLYDRLQFVIKIRQDNDMIDRTDVVYTKNKTKL